MVENNKTGKGQDFETFDWVHYLFLFLSRWYWFVLSVAVALGIAVFYLYSTAPVYTRSTQLLIKDDDKSGNRGTIQDISDLGILGTSKNISNEIQTLCAPVMMHEVVDRLHLDLQLSTKEQLHQRPLYKDAPVNVQFFSRVEAESSLSFDLRILGGNDIELSAFTKNGIPAGGQPLHVKLGQDVRTPVGVLRITATPAFGRVETGTVVTVNKFPLSAVGNMYARRLSVALDDKDGTILRLTMTDEAPQRADDVLLTLIDVYNEKWIQDKNKVAESTFQFISDRLDTISKELGDVDSKISEYKSRNLLPDVQASASMYMQQSTKNQDNLLQLNNQLSMVQYIRSYLNDANRQNQLLPANTGFTSTGIEDQIQKYNEVMLRRNELLANSSMQNALVNELSEKLSEQKAVILRSIDNLIAQIQQQIANVKVSEEGTNQQIASSPRHARLMLSAERQQKVKEELYIFLLQKREENELSKAYTAYNTRIIQPPVGSNVPTSPRRSNILLVAFALGLIVPGALIFLRDTMNNTVRGRHDLEKYSVPFIGEIPMYDIATRKWWRKGRKKNLQRVVVVKEGSKDLINESFRLVRTKLDYYLGSKENAKVFMLTSFNPGSGKTFITANLARTLALKGGRVLAIDLDLRRASLSHMATDSKQGLSSYLNGQEENVGDLIVRDAFGKNTDLMPVGVIPPNPTEILLTDKVRSMFEYARKHYDYVLVDCPPIEVVADASIASNYVDCCLFVIRVGLMDRRLLKDVEGLYREHKYKNMALLLNGGQVVKGKYGSYRYGYGYGYGYGYEEK